MNNFSVNLEPLIVPSLTVVLPYNQTNRRGREEKGWVTHNVLQNSRD